MIGAPPVDCLDLVMHLTTLRAPSAVLMLAGVALALLVGSLVPTPPAAHAIGWSPLVDAPSSYDPQTSCTTTPAPGTVALARWLQRTYPVTGSLGMMRACHIGGTSEHK